ncbi:hypothetical protein [Thalassotalea sp. PS06]|uniref:hypothetical protein n=1 Tax=Thalassotalea sp. PS06 TaxID=2594005 RepID=UPI0011639A80|nr:hypothetical protein [Thalassotalea sp. PS06]QDP02513.1 hypothetical protein FNC98_14830 [Thalassotalea sp. PS06]
MQLMQEQSSASTTLENHKMIFPNARDIWRFAIIWPLGQIKKRIVITEHRSVVSLLVHIQKEQPLAALF